MFTKNEAIQDLVKKILLVEDATCVLCRKVSAEVYCQACYEGYCRACLGRDVNTQFCLGCHIDKN